MDTIKELYYGNIHPYEREIKKDSEIDRLAKLVLQRLPLRCTADGRITAGNGIRQNGSPVTKAGLPFVCSKDFFMQQSPLFRPVCGLLAKDGKVTR